MDSRLENAKEGIELLSLEVRDGAFLEGLPPGTAKTWRRNDIIFATEVSVPETNASRRQPTTFTITTPHAREAGVLFDRLLSLFLPLLDECIVRDFCDRLGEAALEYSGYADRSDQTAVNLLKILLTEAEDILEEMREGEFPYTAGGTESRDGENS